MPFVQLNNVSIGYPAKGAPRIIQSGMNLTAARGELIALIGRNGCGKSTLLRSLACLQPIYEGVIWLNKENLTAMKVTSRAKWVSVVLTDQQATASFTVRELVSIGRDPYTGWLGSLSERDNRVVSQAIEMTYLNGFEERNIHELSDGERQRVFIARALAQDTPIILLDEPTSHLDLPNRINIMLLLQKLARDAKKTIFISTHELETAMQVSDKLWLMDKGKGVSVGVPEDMVLDGNFDTVFHHPSFEFDKEYGSFVVQKRLDQPITTHVKNPDGLVARWTTKALSRKGYQITADAPLRLIVDEERTRWIVEMSDQSIVTYSIEEALRALSYFTGDLH